MTNCPLCHGANFETLAAHEDRVRGNCRTCGPIHVTASAIGKVRRDNTAYLLAAFCRQRNQESIPLVSSDNLDELLSTVPVKTPLAILDCLLLLLAKETVAKGQYSNFDSTYDFPLLAIRHDEVEYYMDELERRELIVKGPSTGKVTITGWERVSQLQRSGCDSVFVFVAMWFDKKMDDFYYKAIEPAIKDAGYVPIRVDLCQHVHKIDEEMLLWIKKCKFMVADFTGNRQGVYFEAGLMVGLSKNVIWTCRKDDMKDLHFDTNHYNFVVYETIDEFKTSLYNRITHVEGLAKPPAAADGFDGRGELAVIQ